jgi:ABC-type uncharacterized transport system substrate-binding protein
MKRRFAQLMILWGVFGACQAFAAAETPPYRVLVVMSYHQGMPWVDEITEGITSVLGADAEVKYVYMDTRRNLRAGPEKAKEAFAAYQAFRPDGVIAADDNAQSFFVVPYLKEKVRTPVMFCGVNAAPEVYGYPAANVSGVLERAHVGESVALIQQLVPSVKTMGYMAKDSPTGREMFQVIKDESDAYPVRSAAFRLPGTMAEANAMAVELRKTCDALFIVAMDGLPDENGVPLTEKEIIPEIADIFGKPTTSPDLFNVRAGLLCAVIKTGQEQGRLAARMLLKAMQKTPVAAIPVTRNHEGKRVINVTALKKLGLNPRLNALIGVQLVRTGAE